RSRVTTSAGHPRGGERRLRGPAVIDAAPPAATNPAAEQTAAATAAWTEVPPSRAPVTAAANASPAPQVSPSWAILFLGTGTVAQPSAVAKAAPRAPSVTATASHRHQPRSAAATATPAPAPRSLAGTALAASASFGVTRRQPGTGSAPRGCGSHTTGIRRAAASSASRTAGSAVTSRP